MELLFQLSKDFFEDSPSRKSHTQDDSAVENVDPSALTYEVSALCSVLYWLLCDTRLASLTTITVELGKRG